jgi:CRP/FNR family transcriptional regulator, cyclic AMP receptor protein
MRRFSINCRSARTARRSDLSAKRALEDKTQQDRIASDPFSTDSKVTWNVVLSPDRVGGFFKDLSAAAMRDFDSIAEPFYVPESTILFREGEELSDILFLRAGRVKQSVNSIDGGRLIVGFSGPGEILGITSGILGCPYDTTAEAKIPCIISSVQRNDFLEYLIGHPVSNQNVTRELSMDNQRTYQQLRNIGMNLTAPVKLARLFFDWCPKDEHEGPGAQIHCSLTHEEIGEHIGISRETVTRSLTNFKRRGLVEQRGTLLIVPNICVLASYAGIEILPSRNSAA